MKYLTALLIASAFPLAAAIDGTVRIDSGALSGIAASTPGIVVFRGIPYAAPPVGNLRWRAPRPAAKWEGVRKMAEFRSRCVQPPSRTNPKEVQGAEDCLYLNVWTPAKTAADKLPVMVWVHGRGLPRRHRRHAAPRWRRAGQEGGGAGDPQLPPGSRSASWRIPN